MRKINKITNIFFVCLTLILTLFTFSGCVKNIKDPTIITNNNIKNVVLIIGDGMGQNHINNAKIHFDLSNLVFENDYLTTVNTSSKSIGTTDSAAAATAMATGVNVANRKIGMDGNSILENIMEIATKYGKKTGIVTTDNLTGATPAAFSSHTTDRGNSEDIVLDQVTSNINLLVGETNNLYEKYRSQFLLENYVMCNSLSELNNNANAQKIVANIDNLKSIYNTEETNQTNLSSVVDFALEFLDNEEGFVLMIECAHIDKFSHNKNLLPALCEVRTLFDVANTVYNFVLNRDDTAVLITADHETGGLKLANNKTEISNNLYSKKSHTSKNVPLYAKNCTFENVKNEVKNTFIFDICKNIVLN